MNFFYVKRKEERRKEEQCREKKRCEMKSLNPSGA